MGTALETSLDVTPLTIGSREFRSRLMVGTGKYRSNSQMIRSIEASGAEVVTVAVRRVDLSRADDEGILHHLDPDQFFLLANTAGCYNADDAIRYAQLGRAAGFNEWVKLGSSAMLRLCFPTRQVFSRRRASLLTTASR